MDPFVISMKPFFNCRFGSITKKHVRLLIGSVLHFIVGGQDRSLLLLHLIIRTVLGTRICAIHYRHY